MPFEWDHLEKVQRINSKQCTHTIKLQIQLKECDQDTFPKLQKKSKGVVGGSGGYVSKIASQKNTNSLDISSAHLES